VNTILEQLPRMSPGGLVAVYCSAIGVAGLTLFLSIRTCVRHAAIILRGWPERDLGEDVNEG